MDVGLAVVFQGTNKDLTDHQVYQQDLRIGMMAEELGFQSIWGIEHHFTDYTMCPDPVQFLSYFAAKSEKLLLGTMVIVLPWHDPMRVAEEVSMLDNMSNGRMILGIGRGLGRVEFDGFGKDMNISREYFTESAQMILDGLEKGYCEFNGEHIKQVRRDIRPAPFKSFKGRTYAAAVSPESSQIMAKLGVGILIIPQKPWHHVERELVDYRRIYREVNKAEPPAPILAGFTYCDENADRAEEMATKWIGGYYRTAMEHYEMASDHLNTTKGYESYAGLNKHIANDADGSIEFFKSIQVYGTPEQCYEKIKGFTQRTGAGAYNAFFNFAGMPIVDVEASMRLFAKEVMPEVKKLPGKPLMEVMKEAAE
ncbi:MAG: LLM class flavin-dependent oxidoreductase [Alphaproteobacteria bacterium]|nr:LLM class flavin-dependent oxidoreductase [Alphaproteobacteria bacterium]